MDILWQELSLGTPDRGELLRLIIRLVAALIIGAIIGLQREFAGQDAGLRTHMLVALGTALFVAVPEEIGWGEDAMSRVIQGITTGIGFLGAGTILKLTQEKQIKGLTTAAGIWMTAAASVAAGVGAVGIALISMVFALIVLSGLHWFERRVIATREEREARSRRR